MLDPRDDMKPDAGCPEDRAPAVRLRDEALLAPLIDQAMPDALFVVDREWRFLKVNARACASLGYTREELLSMRMPDIDEDFDPASARAALDRLASGESVALKGRQRRKDGGVFSVEIHLGRVAADGEWLYIAIAHDIGERELVEQALVERDACYRAVVESSVDGFWMLDDRGRFIAVNDVYVKRSGYSREELLTMRIADLEARETPAAARRHQEKVRRQGADLFETCHRAKSGEIWPVEVNANFRADAGSRYFAFVRDITARKRLEAELRLGEERFRLAMEAAAEGIWDWRLASGEVYYSPGYAAMLGYEPDEIEPHINAWIGQLHPDEAQTMVREANRRLHEFGHCSLEFRLRRKDGGYCWVLSRCKVVERGGDGKPGRVIGAHMDISERKRSELAWQESEERLRLFIEHAPAALAMFDRDMRYLVASRRWRDDYSLGDRAIVGRCHYEVFPEIGEDWRAVHRRGLAGEAVRADEDRFVRADGSAHWLRWEVLPWWAASGEVGGIVIFTEDITERKRARQALEEARNTLAEAQKIAHLGSFEYSVVNGATVWSEEEYRIYGLDPAGPSPSYQDMLARRIHPEDADLFHRTFLAAMLGKGTYELEHRIVGPDGGVRWVYDVAHPYFDEQGRLVRYIGTTMDITERKRQEEEAQRHGELMQELVRQQVAVQTAAAFAHELNQPLVSVAAYTEVALRALRGGKGKAEQLVHAIEGGHQQALRAGRVLHELIDHLHKGEVEPKPFDINHLVRDVVDKLRKTEYHGFHTTLDLEAGLPAVLGNRLQTEKALLNLIQNGLEAMVEAGVSPAAFAIAVRTLAGQRMAHVTVRDGGPGLDPDTARRVFAPFFTTKANGRGLGLGLPISRSLIETQGGQLWLDPEDGPGAVFHFTLPFAHD